MKFLIFPIAISLTAFIQSVALATGPMKSVSAPCYFFKGEKLALKNVCTREGASWAGGYMMFFEWEDSVVTTVMKGLDPGKKGAVCPNQEQLKFDNVCGDLYYRHSKTLKRATPKEIQTEKELIHCIQLKRNSVCWQGSMSAR
jgi:hypothetical protein